MKTKILLSLTALCLFGCATNSSNPNPIGPAITQATVATGVAFAVQQDPSILPYLEAADPVICALSGNGTVNPAQIVAALQSAQINELKTPAGMAALNAALAVYEAIYMSYGTNVQASTVEPYLLAVCNGLKEVTPVTTNKLALPHIR